MTPMRWLVIAAVVGGLAFDLARRGSEEFSCLTEIARVEHEIAVLRMHRDELRVGIQQRLLARVPRTGVLHPADEAGVDLASPRLHRHHTPWEKDALRGADPQQAYASERGADGIPIDVWIRHDRTGVR